jgi:hypothetical protein
MKKIIIRNLDTVPDIKKAIHREANMEMDFCKERQAGNTVQVCFDEEGTIAAVFSESHGKDCIIYTWEYGWEYGRREPK